MPWSLLGQESPPPPALHMDTLEAPGIMGFILKQSSGLLVLCQRGREAASSMPCRICEPPGAEKGPAQLWAVIFAPPAAGFFQTTELEAALGAAGSQRWGRGQRRGEADIETK